MNINISMDESNGQWTLILDHHKIKGCLDPEWFPKLENKGRYHAFMDMVKCICVILILEQVNATPSFSDEDGLFPEEKAAGLN